MVEKNESLSQFVIVCSVKYGHEIHEKNCKRNKKKLRKPIPLWIIFAQLND